MDKESLKKFVKDNPGLVSMKESSYPGLYVLKYKKKVFYDNSWNDFLEECRGTIVDSDFNVISRPFTKIYNYGIEARAPRINGDTEVKAYRKVNGFMVAVTWYDNDILVSTTGSTDSDYVKMARELINDERYREICHLWYDTTFIFECVHRDDPHIIPEKEGMYLIGYRQKDWNSNINIDNKILNILAMSFRTIPVEYLKLPLRDLVELSKKVKHEGFVFYTNEGISAKIKSPYYLVKKFVSRNPRTDKLMRDDIKKSFDEEYYPLLDHIRTNIEEFTSLGEQERLQWVRNFFESNQNIK